MNCRVRSPPCAETVRAHGIVLRGGQSDRFGFSRHPIHGGITIVNPFWRKPLCAEVVGDLCDEQAYVVGVKPANGSRRSIAAISNSASHAELVEAVRPFIEQNSKNRQQFKKQHVYQACTSLTID